MRHVIHVTGILIIIGIFLIGCDLMVDVNENDVPLPQGDGFGFLKPGSGVTGYPVADGWEFGGNSLEPGVFVRGSGGFNFDIYTAAFTLSSSSPLIGDGWDEGDIIFGIGGVIDPNANNPELTHSVRIVSKFSAGNDGWSAGGTGSFSGAGGGWCATAGDSRATQSEWEYQALESLRRVWWEPSTN